MMVSHFPNILGIFLIKFIIISLVMHYISKLLIFTNIFLPLGDLVMLNLSGRYFLLRMSLSFMLVVFNDETIYAVVENTQT